jgi:hypothetical protein
MRIFIDEAGSFVPPTSGDSSYSLVLALIVPSASESQLFYQFLRLRDSWPKQQIEIKGSSLDETRARQVINLLASFDVVVEFVSLDRALHQRENLDNFKSRQAAEITAHVTREHYPVIVHHLVQLERTVSKMPNQLFVQAEITIQLILKVLQIATLYYVQRQPTELGDISWIVDRKGNTLTEMEETWTTLILPMSESHFMKEPLIALKEADYSHFGRYEIDLAVDADMARHIKWSYEVHGKKEKASINGRVINAGRILSEQLQFLDSLDSLGLQLADMLASILRRGLNNRLQKPGWEAFGKLVIYDPEPGWFVRLGQEPDDSDPTFSPRVVDVWKSLNRFSKSMIPRSEEE